jgi:hypothetical protein
MLGGKLGRSNSLAKFLAKISACLKFQHWHFDNNGLHLELVFSNNGPFSDLKPEKLVI